VNNRLYDRMERLGKKSSPGRGSCGKGERGGFLSTMASNTLVEPDGRFFDVRARVIIGPQERRGAGRGTPGKIASSRAGDVARSQGRKRHGTEFGEEIEVQTRREAIEEGGGANS